MALAHTILGVLLDAPAHGYAIKKQLTAAHPEGAALNDGQLYPTLARMEQSGWDSDFWALHSWYREG